jgi:inorganic phosphate transporter, PiT family
MVIAWVVTLPAAAIMGAVAGGVAEKGTAGTVVVAVAGLAIGGGIYVLSRRQPVSANNVNEVSTSRQRVVVAPA